MNPRSDFSNGDPVTWIASSGPGGRGRLIHGTFLVPRDKFSKIRLKNGTERFVSERNLFHGWLEKIPVELVPHKNSDRKPCTACAWPTSHITGLCLTCRKKAGMPICRRPTNRTNKFVNDDNMYCGG